jgi:hypothetical protein
MRHRWWGFRFVFAWWNWRVGISVMPVYRWNKKDWKRWLDGKRGHWDFLWIEVQLLPLCFEINCDRRRPASGGKGAGK